MLRIINGQGNTCVTNTFATPETFDSIRPRLTCRWIHDPVDDALVCVWSIEDVRQDMAEKTGFAVAA